MDGEEYKIEELTESMFESEETETGCLTGIVQEQKKQAEVLTSIPLQADAEKSPDVNEEEKEQGKRVCRRKEAEEGGNQPEECKRAETGREGGLKGAEISREEGRKGAETSRKKEEQMRAGNRPEKENREEGEASRRKEVRKRAETGRKKGEREKAETGWEEGRKKVETPEEGSPGRRRLLKRRRRKSGKRRKPARGRKSGRQKPAGRAKFWGERRRRKVNSGKGQPA